MGRSVSRVFISGFIFILLVTAACTSAPAGTLTPAETTPGKVVASTPPTASPSLASPLVSPSPQTAAPATTVSPGHTTPTATVLDTIPVYTYQVINAYPHDKTAFTQGLAYENGFLYEGTGLMGLSSLRKVELQTGKILQNLKLAEQYFGEGITLYKDTIIQLTWQSEIGWVYDKSTFKPLRRFTYSGEGWGITAEGKRLIMSNGTSTLTFLDPEGLIPTGTLEVRDGDTPIVRLNELELVKGQIFANVWTSNRIAIIEPSDGRVAGWIDLTGLLSTKSATGNVLNGIAYDEQGDRLFVTGKLWPYLFEIKLIEKNRS